MSKHSCYSMINTQTLLKAPEQYDFFIFGKSSEERAYSLVSNYHAHFKADKWLMFDFRKKNEGLTVSELNRYNSINKIIEDARITNIQIISVENYQVGKLISNQDINHESAIALDITAMDFLELSDILFYLISIACVKKLDVYYTEPDLYHYEYNNITFYSHLLQPISTNYIKSYYSTKTDQEEIFVAIIGFQRNVAKQMKDYFEVSQYYSINGFPSYYPKAKDISLKNNYDYMEDIPELNRYSSEANNPFICYNTLLEIKDKSQNSFMNLCPLCCKPMALGACLFALDYRTSTRIVYPFSESVATKTDGIGHTYCYNIC